MADLRIVPCARAIGAAPWCEIRDARGKAGTLPTLESFAMRILFSVALSVVGVLQCNTMSRP